MAARSSIASSSCTSQVAQDLPIGLLGINGGDDCATIIHRETVGIGCWNPR